MAQVNDSRTILTLIQHTNSLFDMLCFFKQPWSYVRIFMCTYYTYTALTHGLQSKWTYLCRVIPNIGHLLSPLDEKLRSDLLSALTGRPPPSNLDCALFALPARLGGLGIRIPSKTADSELQSSLLITSSLKDHILDQDRE